MSPLTDKQMESAIRYNDLHLYEGRSIDEVGTFWLRHTTSGQHLAHDEGLDPDKCHDIFEDKSFMVYVVGGEGGIQDFLYSEPGDAAAGVTPSPATASERDGKFGPGTYRRMETYLESLNPVEAPPPPVEGSSHIIVGGQKIAVAGVKVLTFEDPDGLSIKAASKKGYRKWGAERERANHIAMLHWDVCFSAHSCFKVLTRRGYASCFGIDNPSKEDGQVTVYQWLDPGFYRGAHGGEVA